MAYLWFCDGHDAQRDDRACFCELCVWEFNNVREHLAPYWHRGLKLREGEKVTLPMIKQCTAIIMDHLQELHQPASLESLCGRTIHQYLQGACKELPLPTMMKDKIRFGEYDDHNREEFTGVAKKLQSILWLHLGCTIVRRRKHPLNRF